MRIVLQFISLAGLLLTILPPILFFKEDISHTQQNAYMAIGALIWFLSAIFWLGKKSKPVD